MEMTIVWTRMGTVCPLTMRYSLSPERIGRREEGELEGEWELKKKWN